MKSIKHGTCCILLLFALDMQSLVDVAREEAERRRQLEQQGVHGKVIEGNGLKGTAVEGNVTTSTERPVMPAKSSGRADDAKAQASLRRYQTAIKKLDREIQQTETKLDSLQDRLQSEKWQNPKSGRSSSRSRARDSTRLQAQMEKLQAKLKQLRDERFEVFEAGKKMGFLPGDLDGRGLMP